MGINRNKDIAALYKAVIKDVWELLPVNIQNKINRIDKIIKLLKKDARMPLTESKKEDIGFGHLNSDQKLM